MAGDSIDIKKLLQQQLSALAQSGISEIPSGNGELEIAFGAFAVEQDAAIMEPVENAPSSVHATVASAEPKLNDKADRSIKASDQPAAVSVIGAGNAAAKLAFVVESQRTDSLRHSGPFSKAADELFGRILAACKISREDIFVIEIEKSRPSVNPSKDEMEATRTATERELATIEPDFVCCLGSVAGKMMLGTTLPFGRLRGKIHSWKDARLVVTYHPAYLLRNEGAKRHVWEDMKMLVKEMGIDLSK